MKQLEIYGTLGPKCQDTATLEQLFRAGMTGVRLNLSHVDLDGCTQWLEHLRQAAGRCGVSPQLLIDLKGPELRVGDLPTPLTLTKGDTVLLGAGGVPVPELLIGALSVGQELLLDDGALLIRVTENRPDAILCQVLRGGVLRSRKSIAAPGAKVYPPTLAQSDLHNIALAPSCGVTGVMLPFVRSREDLKNLRQALHNASAGHIRIFAKIENRLGAAALPNFVEEADEIVIARGDLGNDMPLWELPQIQKEIAALCRERRRDFMVVTQLLHSMHHAAVPTRAEVSDIFNAVLDGASSLMLTGETAAGDYPVQAMTYLCRTASQALGYLSRDCSR